MSNRNNSFDAVLRVVATGEERAFPSGFRKRELLLTDDAPKYPATFPVDFGGDLCDAAGAFVPGDHVAVRFSIKGHMTDAGRAFVTLRGFAIERAVAIGGGKELAR